jgi:hypothetical protein
MRETQYRWSETENNKRHVKLIVEWSGDQSTDDKLITWCTRESGPDLHSAINGTVRTGFKYKHRDTQHVRLPASSCCNSSAVACCLECEKGYHYLLVCSCRLVKKCQINTKMRNLDPKNTKSLLRDDWGQSILSVGEMILLAATSL